MARATWTPDRAPGVGDSNPSPLWFTPPAGVEPRPLTRQLQATLRGGKRPHLLIFSQWELRRLLGTHGVLPGGPEPPRGLCETQVSACTCSAQFTSWMEQASQELPTMHLCSRGQSRSCRNR